MPGKMEENELEEMEEMEEMNIEDDVDDTDVGDTDDGDGAEESSGDQEKPDRGDIVTDDNPDSEDEAGDDEAGDDEEDPPEEEEKEGEAAGDEKENPDKEESEDTSTNGIPHSRVSAISQEKNAYKAITKGLVAGEISPDVIVDLGGEDAVAKAIAKGDLALSELLVPVKKTTLKEQRQEGEEPVDVEKLWADYQEANEDGDFEKAKTLLAAARAEETKQTTNIVRDEIRKDRKDESDRREMTAATEVANTIKDTYPVLKDTGSVEYSRFTGLADAIYKAEGGTLADALKEASVVLFGAAKGEAEKESDVDVKKEEESKKVETAADRKRAAILRNAKAANKQPPRQDKGSGNRASSVSSSKIASMSEDEFDNMSVAEKKRARGD